MLKNLQICYAHDGEGQEETEVAPEAMPEAEPQPEIEPSQNPVTVPIEIMQRRVAYLTRQKADLERKLELAQLDKAAELPPASKPDLLNEAQILAEQMRRDERSLAVASAGAAIAPDFMLKINMMNQALGQLPNSFIDAVLDAGETEEGAANLLYDLSKDLQKAGAILAMSPTKMAVALTKLRTQTRPQPKTPIPNTPTPIPQKVGVGKAAPAPQDLGDPNMSMAEWVKKRDEEARARRGY